MKVSIILGHPTLGSFNHAIVATAEAALRANGHEVRTHDLYREEFDPVMPSEEIPKDAPLPPEIEAHCQEIGEADGIIIVHPNYWSAPPAILRGWVDRVLRPGRAYNFVPDGQGGAKPVGPAQGDGRAWCSRRRTRRTRRRSRCSATRSRRTG